MGYIWLCRYGNAAANDVSVYDNSHLALPGCFHKLTWLAAVLQRLLSKYDLIGRRLQQHFKSWTFLNFFLRR